MAIPLPFHSGIFIEQPDAAPPETTLAGLGLWTLTHRQPGFSGQIPQRGGSLHFPGRRDASLGVTGWAGRYRFGYVLWMSNAPSALGLYFVPLTKDNACVSRQRNYRQPDQSTKLAG